MQAMKVKSNSICHAVYVKDGIRAERRASCMVVQLALVFSPIG